MSSDAPLDPREQNEVVKTIIGRTTHTLALILAVILLISIIAIASLVKVTSSAQADADELQADADRRDTETLCRSDIATDFAIKQGELEALIADGLVLLSRGEPLDGVAAQLEVASSQLRVLSEKRENGIETCAAQAAAGPAGPDDE